MRGRVSVDSSGMCGGILDLRGGGNYLRRLRADYQADAAGRMAGSMQDIRLKTSPAKRVAFLQEILNARGSGRGNSQELRLLVEVAVEFEIGFVDQDRRAGGTMKRGKPADVVYMGVSADDGADVEFVGAQDVLDAAGFIAGIDDDGLAGLRVT